MWPAPPVPLAVDPSSRDLRGLRLGAAFAMLGLLAANAIFVYAAFLRLPGAPRASLGLFIMILYIGGTCGMTFASTALAFGVGASIRHARVGPRGWALAPLVSFALVFALPAFLVIGLGEATSSSWWVVYVAFLPGFLLMGAHVALVEPARTLTGWAVRPAILVLFAVAGTVGPAVSMLALFYSSRFRLSEAVGLPFTALAIACNLVLVGWSVRAERRRRRAIPAWQPPA